MRAIARIAEVVRTIDDHRTTIASAVEEQTATTGELTRSVASDVERARAAARELDGRSAGLNRLLGVCTV